MGQKFQMPVDERVRPVWKGVVVAVVAVLEKL